MQERHTDRKRYFDEQALTTQKYVIPFISEVSPITAESTVLEIGCGEGGNMVPFLDMGCTVVGIDLNQQQLENAAVYFQDHPNKDNLELICQDIYKVSPEEVGRFDVIVMRDVIEHIPNQEKFMGYVKNFLKDDGLFFLGFPPWQMPFGGHQQTFKGFLGKTPWIHLLPGPLYPALMKAGGGTKEVIDYKMFIKETGISIERFKKIIKDERYIVHREVMYFINPNYETKFNLTPRVQSSIISKIPYFRNFATTCCYYVLSKPKA